MAEFRRRIFLVDSKVQGALVFRVVGHWVYCMFTISMLLIWWNLSAGPPRPLLLVLGEVYERFAPAVAASILILPLVVMDILRLSNRFAGPARRLRNGLSELAEGKEVPPLLFRDNDFWQETAAEFNRVNDRIRQLVARQVRSQADAAPIDAESEEEPFLAGRAD